MKIWIVKSIIICLVITGFSCSENIPDCPTKMCILAGEWQLAEVYDDGVKQNLDLSKFRMNLIMPNSTATEGNFSRTNTSGIQDDGSWKTANVDELLVLSPSSSPQEDYIIDYFSPRKLVLIVNRESTKVGPTKIKYVFEPH